MTDYSDGVNTAESSASIAIPSLVDCEAVVSQDGDVSQFTFTDQDGRPLVTAIGIEHIGEIVAEMEEASLRMINCQATKLDCGAHKLEDLSRAARRPVNFKFAHENGECVFTFQTGRHAPMAVRMTLHQTFLLKIMVDQAMRNSIH